MYNLSNSIRLTMISTNTHLNTKISHHPEESQWRLCFSERTVFTDFSFFQPLLVENKFI